MISPLEIEANRATRDRTKLLRLTSADRALSIVFFTRHTRIQPKARWSPRLIFSGIPPLLTHTFDFSPPNYFRSMFWRTPLWSLK